MAIDLKEDDQIVQRANLCTSPTPTEIGFIPGDKNGCKIYASVENGKVKLLAIHSGSYGCRRLPEMVVVHGLD